MKYLIKLCEKIEEGETCLEEKKYYVKFIIYEVVIPGRERKTILVFGANHVLLKLQLRTREIPVCNS